MLVDSYASLPHYAEHLQPVLEQLERRGVLGERWAPRHGEWWGRAIARRDLSRPVLVAGFADMQRVNPSPVILLEHGAGQAYEGTTSGSYSGGAGWERARLFLCPNDAVARRWRATYRAPAVVVGSPKLDRWHGSSSTCNRERASFRAYQSIERAASGDVQRRRPVVAVTFHWECSIVPETRSAWQHYDRALPDLVTWADAAGVELLGHGHPRLWGKIERRWRRLGVEPVEHFVDVLERADLLVGDNTSALPEFASTGRPVLWLNAPWYRRDVDHGGRFWTWPQGQVTCDEPDELPDRILQALADPPPARLSRSRMVQRVYPLRDGQAAARAADAIERILR